MSEAFIHPTSVVEDGCVLGAGVHIVQAVGLALATDLAAPESRPRVVALLYVMLLAGMLASALVFGALLKDFSQLRLIQVVQGAAEGQPPGQEELAPRDGTQHEAVALEDRVGQSQLLSGGAAQKGPCLDPVRGDGRVVTGLGQPRAAIEVEGAHGQIIARSARAAQGIRRCGPPPLRTPHDHCERRPELPRLTFAPCWEQQAPVARIAGTQLAAARKNPAAGLRG